MLKGMTEELKKEIAETAKCWEENAKIFETEAKKENDTIKIGTLALAREFNFQAKMLRLMIREDKKDEGD